MTLNSSSHTSLTSKYSDLGLALFFDQEEDSHSILLALLQEVS